MESDASSPPVAPELQELVVNELEKCRDQIVERISKTRKLTDTEVYQAGVALDAVVRRAQSYMTEVNERMTATAESEDGVGDTLKQIQRTAKLQERQVEMALENLAGIAKAGRQIREMAGASRLLALNARVESARFGGEGGRAFNVIADEMRELSVSVERTNTMVSKLAAQLEKSLPVIQQQTAEMKASVESLVEEMGQRNQLLQKVFQESIAAGGDALEGVLGSAREGLSHLQFQDLMIQDLEGIERIVGECHNTVAKMLSTEGFEATPSETFLGTIGAELDDSEDKPGQLVSGHVLLF